MVRRKLNVKRHVVAVILTLCFFIIGVLIGTTLTSERVKFLQDKSDEQAVDFESLQTQYLYVSFLNENRSCAVVENTFEANVEKLEDTRKQLESFIKSAQINKKSYDLLKRQYIISQLRYWLLAKSTQEVCDRDLVTVFYFFSNQEACPDCNNQGTVLTYLKKTFQDKLLIFSFDGEFDKEPFIPILRNVYNITTYPTVIVEDNQLNNFQNKDDLLKEICSHFTHDYEECS